MSKLPYEFYNRHVVTVAKELLGQKFVFGKHHGIITETEAYRGFDDAASHAYKGKTKRSEIMFGPAGHLYVYMIYGMYFCLNIVCEDVETAGAVLIRGIKLPDISLDGPGKLCRHLGITKAHNGIDIIDNKTIYISKGLTDYKYKATARIGIKSATDKMWRFIMTN